MFTITTGDNAKYPGGADLTISLSPPEAKALGTDAVRLGDCADSLLWAIALLRTGGTDITPTEPDNNDWYTVIHHLSFVLQPRLEGVISAAIRAHQAAGGSVGQLALAMEVPRSTAQYRRQALADAAALDTWENWARGDISA